MFGKKPKVKKYNPSPDLVRATYRLLLEDKAMLAVLAVGGLASSLVIAAILVPAWTIAHVTPDLMHGGLSGLLVYTAALWASSFITVLSTGVVVAAAHVQCDGGKADVRQAIAVAWSRRGPLAAWATVSTIIALLADLLQRFGAAGAIVRLLAGLTWAVATVFAIPILIAEGTGPFETARRSAGVVKRRFGTLVRSTVWMSAPWIVAGIVALLVTIVGIITFVEGLDGSPVAVVVGAVLMIGGGAGFFFCTTASAALSAYLDTLLYRHSTGQSVPGVDPWDMPEVLPS